ncbi:MAG TPA: hypothetical protein VKR21_02410 [Solirubrobacteraceae bacterium]|nr:hypothetical protein [Solirubrobacteraceae bacterium]
MSNTSPGQPSSGSLPFTGLDLGLLALVGSMMLGLGLVQRRMSKQR